MTPHIPEDGNEIFSRIAGETARGTLMFRFSKPETPRAALFVFLRNETRAKSGFVSYVSISLCFDFDPNSPHQKTENRLFFLSLYKYIISRLETRDEEGWTDTSPCSLARALALTLLQLLVLLVLLNRTSPFLILRALARLIPFLVAYHSS